MSPPVRLLQVTASLAPRDGGPSVGALALAREFARLGVLERLVSTDADGAVERLDHGLFRRELAAGVPLALTRVHAPRRIKASRELWRVLKELLPRVDLVHVHGHYLFSSAAAAHLARRAGKPYVVQPHGVLEPYQRRTGRLRKLLFDRVVSRGYLARAAGVVFATQSEALAARDLVPAEQAFVVSLGASLPAVPEGWEPSWWRPEDERRLRVVFLGRLAPKKRVDLLLAAWGEVVAAVPDAVLLVGGDGDSEPTARLRQQAAPLGDSVRFLGRVTGPDKTALLERADVFALVSENENFAVSVAESCAAGTPVVVSDQVALHGLVERRDAGLVVRELAVPKVRDALVALLTDPGARATKAANARAAWEAELQWSRTAQRLVEVYAYLLGRGPDPR